MTIKEINLPLGLINGLFEAGDYSVVVVAEFIVAGNQRSVWLSNLRKLTGCVFEAAV